MITLKEIKKLIRKYNNLTSDDKRIKFLKENNNLFKVMLDSDCHHVTLVDDDFDEQFFNITEQLNINDLEGFYNKDCMNLFTINDVNVEIC